MAPSRGHRRRSLARAPPLVPLLSVLLALPGCGVEAQQGLDGEQLAKLVAWELQNEEKRANESLFSFYEFQDVSEMDCQARLVYLLNRTVALRDEVQSYHSDILGVAGLYMQLLPQIPDENSWIWLLVTAHERILQKVTAYWSRAVALALDQHTCLVASVRDALLDSVVSWKKLQATFTEMQWSLFAFGRYNAEAGAKRLTAAAKAAAGAQEVPPRAPPEADLVAANLWVSNVIDWSASLTHEIYEALRKISVPDLQDTGTSMRAHHQDEHGSFVTYEFLRRKVFGQWAIDKGLLRGLLRHVWQPPLEGDAPQLTVADFGAGGGHYSTWLNETGLVIAHAFDGTRDAAALTGGAVQEVNLIEEMQLWQSFDWVMCLEVGEHVPKPFAPKLLQNLRRHARYGLVMSWSDDWEGIGHVNCLSREEFVSSVQNETGFMLDPEATETVKAACEIDYIARTIAVFRSAEAAAGGRGRAQ